MLKFLPVSWINLDQSEQVYILRLTIQENLWVTCILLVAPDSDSGEVAAEKEKVPMVFAEIRPDEIPDVPFQKFLYRGKQEEEAVTPAGDAKWATLRNKIIDTSCAHFIIDHSY